MMVLSLFVFVQIIEDLAQSFQQAAIIRTIFILSCVKIFSIFKIRDLA